MGLEFCSFASGSSGNSYMIRSENTAVLLDCGTAGKNILAGLESAGMTADDLSAILLTHEHSDHVKSLRMMGRRAKRSVVLGTAGTLDAVRSLLPEGRAEEIHRSSSFFVGDLRVTSFPVSHDAADPVAYTFECGGEKAAVMTDTGFVSREMFDAICDADILVLESNHDVDLLRIGPYPYPLKRRILSDRGHLSNVTAGETIGLLLDGHRSRRMPTILLGHLSRQNNTPDIARQTVENMLFEEDYYPGKHLRLGVALRDEPTPLIRAE